jgi:hypothetical protein
MTVISTSSYGSHPTDITVRTCLLAAFDDIRANPYLLDFCFNWLMTDELTKRYYGEKELNELKDWFLNNEIPITTGYNSDAAKLPHITIWLGDQSEHQKITGDTNDIPQERIDMTNIMSKQAPALVFTPLTFDPATGIITLPSNQSTANIYPGMRVWDKVNNRHYPILEVLSDSQFQLDEDLVLNLTNAQVVNASDLYIVSLEGITYRESVKIVVSTQGDPVKTIALHQIVLFCLNKYKQQYLEARGFELPQISSSGMGGPMQGPSQSQWIFQRTINVSGLVRYYWPKSISAAVQGIGLGLTFDAPLVDSNQILDQQADQGWSVDPWEED